MVMSVVASSVAGPSSSSDDMLLLSELSSELSSELESPPFLNLFLRLPRFGIGDLLTLKKFSDDSKNLRLHNRYLSNGETLSKASSILDNVSISNSDFSLKYFPY